MKREKSKNPGAYQRTIQGLDAFVPNLLPPPLTATRELTRRVEQATYLLGQVEMCRTLLPNANLLIYSSLQNEALASSTIEGTIASPQELVLFQAAQRYERQSAKEVANYAEALEWGCNELPHRPITTRLILGLHERLLNDVRGASAVGRFKAYQNAIGSRQDDPIERAVFIPAPPEMVAPLMADLERYFNLENGEQKVVQCALAHYQFETIHPFADGNDRVGRLLIILHMIQLGLLSAPLVYPSVYFERNRQSYYKGLQGVRDRGEWDVWLNFFAEGIIEQCKETIQFTQTILKVRQELHESFANVSRRASLNAVLNAFFEHPVLSIREIADRANMAYHSVQSALVILEEKGMVHEITGKQKGRVYACRPVMRTIFRTEG